MTLPEPYYADATTTLYVGDCIDVLAAMDEASVDAVVCDPPYGIGFMGQEWDGKAIDEAARQDAERRQDLGPHSSARPGRSAPRSSSAFGNAAIQAGPVRGGAAFQQWCEQWAAECLRVLKPGGHLLAFGGSRTYHRLAAGVEDAGFEVRDQLQWLYGSGFPKSLDVSKAIDAAAGAERADVYDGREPVADNEVYGKGLGVGVIERRPSSPDAQQWDGWGTALKPAHEPVVMARKPLAGTVAANVLTWGTGAVNIDGCRVGVRESRELNRNGSIGYGGSDAQGCVVDGGEGRWPANVVLDEDAAAMLDQQSGHQRDGVAVNRNRGDVRPQTVANAPSRVLHDDEGYGGEGGASRFFYVAKASRAERDASNHHPTVKPVALMRWLIRLVTPPDGVVVDPFAGSGTTGVAAAIESKRCVLIEREPEYADIVVRRLSKPIEPTLDGLGGAA